MSITWKQAKAREKRLKMNYLVELALDDRVEPVRTLKFIAGNKVVRLSQHADYTMFSFGDTQIEDIPNLLFLISVAIAFEAKSREHWRRRVEKCGGVKTSRQLREAYWSIRGEP